MKQDAIDQKRYALLLSARESDYVRAKYGGYLNVFVDAFGSEGEVWDLFRVVDGEFPEEEELDKYDGFIVSGSPYDAYGDDIWILRLCLLLQTLDFMKKKVLGVCFGHQVRLSFFNFLLLVLLNIADYSSCMELMNNKLC